MPPCALIDPPPGALVALAVPAPMALASTDDVFLFPATPAQRRFWLLDGMQPGGNPALNFTLTLWLSGALDRPALERAITEVSGRHEALRTTFAAERGHLRQVVAAEVPPFTLPFHDVADYPADEQDAVAPHFIGQEAHTPFDLRRGPLWRARLVRVAVSEHFLLLSIHNILCDSWTSGVLVRELGELYNAFHRGAVRSPLPPPPIQFGDYADWLHGQLADDATAGFAPALAHWRTALAGRLPAVELPTDGARPTGIAASARRLFAEATEAMLLPRDLAAGLKTFAVREGMTVFMVYFAGFLALLHRLAGETDLVVVTPSANRGRPETEGLVGLLVNPLLLRVDAGGDPSGRELLRRVRVASLGAFAHGELPFERVVEELRPARLPVSFLHQGVFLHPADLAGGLRLTPLPGFSGGALYELLGAVMEEPGGGTRVIFEHNADLFGPETVRRWLGHYQTLLAGLLADPDAPISELPLLTPAQRRGLGLMDPPPPAPELPDLLARLTARVTESLAAPAAREGRRELSNAELLARLGALGPDADRETALFGLAGAVAAWRTGGKGEVVEIPPAFGARAQALAARLGLGPKDVFGTLTPATEPAAREEAAAALLAGATLVSPRKAGRPANVPEWLEKERVTVAALPVAALAGEPRPAALRLILTTAGEGPGIVTRLELKAAGGTVALDGRAIAGVRLAVVGRPIPGPPPVGGASGAAPTGGGPEVGRPTLPQPLGVPGELVVVLGDGAPIHTGETFRRRADGAFERIVSPTAGATAPAAAPEAPWLTLHYQLIAIWEDVLGVSPVGLREDFFTLGGNSILALRMLARVEEACGHVVLPATLFTHPTVAGLAEEIAHEETGAAPALLAVRETGDRSPLFFLHGDLAGGGFYCRKLAGQLGEDQPFYALPPADVRRLPPGQTIESMAASHLAALRAVRPHGPYRLGGFCLGGLVAFEVAQRLVAEGETVENLVMIDAEPLPPGPRRLRRTVNRLARLRGLDVEGQLRLFTRGHYLLARLRRWRGLPWRQQLGIARRRLLPGGGHRAGLTVAALPDHDGRCCADNNLPAPTPADFDRGWDAGGAFLWASGGYRPSPYAGRVSLLLSTDTAGAANPENPTARWRRLATQLEVRELKGSHLACLTDHVAALGAVVSGCLES